MAGPWFVICDPLYGITRRWREDHKFQKKDADPRPSEGVYLKECIRKGASILYP